MSIIQGNAHQGSTRGFYPKLINGSLRFNDNDSAYLSWTPASAGNRKTWTWSGWVKRCTLGGSNINRIITAYQDDDNFTDIRFANDDTINFRQKTGNVEKANYSTLAVFRDPSAWYHIVVIVDTTDATAADRYKIYVNGVQQSLSTTTTYPQNQDTFFSHTSSDHAIGAALENAGAARHFDGYMADVHFIDGQALTASDFGETKNGVWVAKDYAGTYGTNGFYLTFEDDTEVEAFNTVLYRGTASTQSITGVGFQPDLVWIKNRDAIQHHNLFDSVRGSGKLLYSNLTNAEATSTTHLNSFDSDGFTVGSATSANGSGNGIVAWCWDAGANNAVTGHSSVTYTGNGLAGHKITGFGFSPDLVWIKRRDATDNNVLKDVLRGVTNTLVSETTLPESNYGANYNLQSFDSDGFTTTSGLYVNGTGKSYVAWGWDAGDSAPATNDQGSIDSTVKSSGDFSVITYTGVGPASAANEITVGHGLTSKPDFVIVKRRNGTNDWFVFTDIVDGSNDYLYLNQTVAKGDSGNSVPTDTVINLGGSLNTSGGTYVAYAWRNVTGKQKFGTYTGNGSSTGPVVTTGFRPGFVIIKRTDSSGGGWYLKDSSRNPLGEQTLFLDASDADAEATGAQVTFSDTGFQVTNPDAGTNASGGTYIYAAFAGSYSDYITDYNTDGSIDSRVKANPTTGFSIVSYTGSTSESVGHGLSSAPKFIIVKDRSTTSSWAVYHQSVQDTTANGFLELNSTAAVQTGSNPRFLSGTAGTSQPTSTVFYVNNYSGSSTNNTGNNYIAYCWAEKTGYSKFGSYTGNATSVDLGFNPAFILIKRITGTGKAWWLFDNTREVDGQFGDYQIPNEAYPDQTVATAIAVSGTTITFPNNWDSTHDGSASSTYIYAAFADTREAAFWLDQSGNDNDWQPVNLDHNDTVADSPTNNFATWNPIAPYSGSTYSEGNLKVTTGSSQYGPVLSTIAVSSGKYYVEFTQGSGSYTQLGCVSTDKTLSTTIGLGSGNNSFAYVQNDGSFRQGSVTTSGYGDTWTTGDVIGMALDLDNDEVTYYKNGVSQGTISILNASVGLTSGKTYFIALSDNDAGGGTTVTANFGQQPFKYNPPE